MAFVGRIKELKEIQCVLETCKSNHSGSFITITGERGIGKSELVHQGLEKARSLGYATSGPINLSETSNQAPLCLIEKLVTSYGRNNFPNYERELRLHHEAELERKLHTEASVLSTFIEELIAFSREHSLLIVFDTVEAINGKRLINWLFEDFTKPIIQSIVVMVAGRNPIDNPDPTLSIQLKRFSSREVHLLAKALCDERREPFELSTTETKEIYKKTQGKPIIATLAIEWLLETGDPQDILSIPAVGFSKEIALRFRFLPAEENSVIILMAILDRRFNIGIYGKMVPLDYDTRVGILRKIRRFSFIKWEENGDLLLHEEMRDLLHNFGAIPKELYIEMRRRVVENYYQPLLAQRDISLLDHQYLILDTVYYMLGYSPDNAYELFNMEFDKALNEYELVYCKRLLELMKESKWPPSRGMFLEVMEGELLLAQHNPFDAIDIYKRLGSNKSIIQNPGLMARVFDGLGRCMTLGCELGGKDMSKALENLEKALALVLQINDKSRSASILFNIGLTYEALGRHDDAFNYYDQAINDALAVPGSPDYLLAARITDYTTGLLLQGGKRDQARESALKGLEWRKKLNNNYELAKSYRKLAPIIAYGAHDEKALQEAFEYYQKATELFTATNDQYGLADTFQSLGWVYHEMSKDAVQARMYAEKSISICNRYGFGKVKGESLALLFDVAEAAGERESVMPILEDALDVSRRHAGIYTIQHMLSHKIAILKQMGQYSQIPDCIEEMKSYIQRGTRFRVFYGRSLVLWGDCAFDEKEYDLAFESYHDGYQALALAGHHTAWEAYGAYKQLVENHLNKRLTSLDSLEGQKQSKAFISFWTDAGLASSHPEIINTCKSYL